METQHRHRSNDITSGLLHLLGVFAAVAILVILTIFAVLKGTVWHVLGYVAYGSGLIALYFASASYHFIPPSMQRLKQFAQKFDHAMIFVLIAATYTPIAFLVLNGGWRWSIFGTIWGLAILGLTLKFAIKRLPHTLTVVLYVVMGWLILVALGPLIKNIDTLSLFFLVSGGVAYSFGILFFALEHIVPQRKYFWMHEIFHLFVLAGSALHSVVMFRLLT